MIFTDIDRRTMESLSTLLKVADPYEEMREEIVNVGQYLGVPKEDTLELMEEWDDADTITLKTEEEKQRFLHFVFSFMEEDENREWQEIGLYKRVIKNLGLKRRSNN